jgi:hypothetical protein
VTWGRYPIDAKRIKAKQINRGYGESPVFPIRTSYHPRVFQIIENSYEKCGDIPSPSGRGYGEGRSRGPTLIVR